jgi:predicted metal-dependent enzyme (double-stranded beta helix superfamily)
MQNRLGILDRFDRWSDEIRALRDAGDRKGYFQQELPALLQERSLFAPVMEAIVGGGEYPDVRPSTMFDSEIVLYRDPGRLFSVRFYLWGPGEYDPVHDHNSWGVIGTVLGTLDTINYRRLDDGAEERHAVLEECSRQFIPAGRTYAVFPLNRGIHRTGNASEPAIVQVGVYGENLTGRTYVNVFDVRTGEVNRLYLPHVKKRMLARRALDLL